MEASSGEKGPFHELASGPLKRGEPLTMTVFDDDHPVFRVTLEDFSAQADTQLSPTAGWGLPANGMHFSIESDDPSSVATIFISLAATSLGRGFDSVGHAPGVYRNRMKVEVIE